MSHWADNMMVELSIPAKHLEDAYQAMCAFDQKREFGLSPIGFTQECTSAQEILEYLRLATEIDDQSGNLRIIGFNGTMGDEEIFLNSIAPYVENDSYIEFIGEQYEMWRFHFVDGKMYYEEGYLSWG